MKKKSILILLFMIFGDARTVAAGMNSDATLWRVVSEYCIVECKAESRDPYRSVIGSSVAMTSNNLESKFTDECRNHVVFTAGRETRKQLMNRFLSIYGTAFIKANAEQFATGDVIDTMTATCVHDRLRYEIAFLFNISETSADVLVEEGRVLHLMRVSR